MRNVLSVFIASPSDLNVERTAIREVQTEINDVLREINWSVEFLGWEGTLPGTRRPQQLINADIEKCDLFLGLLWKRWGSPPASVGPYTSGFEEEFELAQRLNQASAKPEIWLFFKKIEEDQISDAGPHLRRVLKFRKQVIKQRSLMFKEFGDVADLRSQLRTLLERHVLRLSRKQELPESPAISLAPKPRLLESINQPVDHVGQSPECQLRAFAIALEPCFEDADLRLVNTKEFDNMAFFAARALLLAHGCRKVVDGSFRPVGTHDLNTLYRHRHLLQATDTEREVLWETIISDQSSVSPGWFWIDSAVSVHIQPLLLRTLLETSNLSVQKNILRILRFMPGEEPSVERRRFMQDEIGRYENDELRDLAWRFLVDAATTNDIQALKGCVEGTWLQPRLEWLEDWISAGRNLKTFLAKSKDPNLLPLAVRKEVSKTIRQLSNEQIDRLLPFLQRQMLRDALDELDSRGEEISEALRTKASQPEPTLATLAGFATSSDQEEEARYSKLSAMSTDSLLRNMSWADTESPSSYRILVERGEIDHELACSDINSRFVRIFEAYRNDSIAVAGQDVEALKVACKHIKSLEKYRDLIVTQFTKEALRALALAPEPEDGALARMFLNNFHTIDPALDILEKVGTPDDLERLVKVAEDNYGSARIRALAVARKLTKNDALVCSTLLTSTFASLQEFGAWLLPNLSIDQVVTIMPTLLYHDNESVRTAAVLCAIAVSSRDQLERLIDTYQRQPEYYYNVVTWLDRYLYAPKPVFDALSSQVHNPWNDRT